MLHAIEAVYRHGAIQPIHLPPPFEEGELLMVVRLPSSKSSVRGAMRGELSSVEEFLAYKQHEIEQEEHS